MGGHAMYEWVYIAAVVAILIFVGAASWDVERIIEEVPAEAETIKVIGQQWFWSFEHADGTKEVNELHVQKGKPYRFEITSLDVNHNFNVPDWTLLMDAVPGRINTLWNMFTEEGEYLIQCREYCGFSHYNMKAKLFVEPAVTPVAAETPPTSTPITTPNATVVPNQQQQQQQQQPATQEQQQQGLVPLTGGFNSLTVNPCLLSGASPMMGNHSPLTTAAAGLTLDPTIVANLLRQQQQQFGAISSIAGKELLYHQQQQDQQQQYNNYLDPNNIAINGNDYWQAAAAAMQQQPQQYERFVSIIWQSFVCGN